MPTVQVFGIDVSKHELVIAGEVDQRLVSVANRPRSIRTWLSTLSETAVLGIESTGAYHQALMQFACDAGHRVYLVDARRLSAYRKALGVRAKTDRCDARLIAHYVGREYPRLHAHRPPEPAIAELQHLLRRRARVVQARVRLEASLKGCPECRTEIRAVMRSLNALIRRIDAKCEQTIAAQSDGAARRLRLASIPGVGKLCSIGLHVAMARTPYRSSDALIAGLGLDPRPNDSGQHQGRRRLTKRGPSELRRLLYLAAMSAIRHSSFRPIFVRARDRGLGTVSALLTVARKIVRIAFAINRSGSTFTAERLLPACQPT